MARNIIFYFVVLIVLGKGVRMTDVKNAGSYCVEHPVANSVSEKKRWRKRPLIKTRNRIQMGIGSDRNACPHHVPDVSPGLLRIVLKLSCAWTYLHSIVYRFEFRGRSFFEINSGAHLKFSLALPGSGVSTIIFWLSASNSDDNEAWHSLPSDSTFVTRRQEIRKAAEVQLSPFYWQEWHVG